MEKREKKKEKIRPAASDAAGSASESVVLASTARPQNFINRAPIFPFFPRLFIYSSFSSLSPCFFVFSSLFFSVLWSRGLSFARSYWAGHMTRSSTLIGFSLPFNYCHVFDS